MPSGTRPENLGNRSGFGANSRTVTAAGRRPCPSSPLSGDQRRFGGRGDPLLSFHVAAEDLDKEIPAALSDPANPATTEVAVLAGGCFWGQQGVFEHVKGVTRVVAGYSGGDRHSATYNRVSEGDTGHAESVQITFDPHQVTYGQLLRIYFSVAHDPSPSSIARARTRARSTARKIFAASPETETPRRGPMLRPARSKPCLCRPHRHQGRWAERLLSGRGLSPGLPGPEPPGRLYPNQRLAQDRRPEAGLAGLLPRKAVCAPRPGPSNVSGAPASKILRAALAFGPNYGHVSLIGQSKSWRRPFGQAFLLPR